MTVDKKIIGGIVKKGLFLLSTVILLGTSSFYALEASGNEKWPLLSKEEDKESSFLHSRKTKSREIKSNSLIEQQEEKFKEGSKKFSQSNYDEAFNCFMEAAELGHPQAQYNLGLCYELGVGVKASSKDAIKWYFYSAANKNEKAIQKIISFSQNPR
jgi:hypothetical protein